MGLAVAWLQIFWAGNQANMSRLSRKQDTLVIATGVQVVQRAEQEKQREKAKHTALPCIVELFFFGARWQGLIKTKQGKQYGS